MGVIDEGGRLAYDALLSGHIAQATLDPTLVGGEAATQGAFKAWAQAHGVPEAYREELRPSSLVRDLGAGAAAAGSWMGGTEWGARTRRRASGLMDLLPW